MIRADITRNRERIDMPSTSPARHASACPADHTRDCDIRAVLLNELRAQDASAAIFEELPLLRGRGRADVAFVNGELCGFEIKSARDSLRRLGDQVHQYDAVFEYTTVVVANHHLRGVRKLVPAHWGISLAVVIEDVLTIKQIRKARRNRALDPRALARLLWKRECIRVLAQNGVRVDVSTPVIDLWPAVAGLPFKSLCRNVREALKSR